MAQYNKNTQQYLPQAKTLFEVVMLADKDGQPVSSNSGTPVEFSGASADAFGRGRVSEPFTLADYKHTYGDSKDFLTHSVDGGTVSYTTNHANVVLQTSNLATSKVVHQSKLYHHYLPGKSQLVFASFCFNDSDVFCKKRIGYFDDNNGIFFEKEIDDAGNISLKIVIRSNVSGSVVDVEIPQDQWNLDKCDGTGNSGFNLDIEKTQLLFLDFQWLGVGRIRVGFIHDGVAIIAHQELHSNNLDVVYWSNPNLPIRGELLNTAANSGASMQMICSTVICEGGYIEAGKDWEVQNTTVKQTQQPGGTWTPILALRLKNTFNGYDNRVLFLPEAVSVYADLKSVSFKVGKLTSASSLSAGVPLVWNSVNDDSAVEYCENATGINLTDFESFNGGFISSGVAQGSQTAASPNDLIKSKRNIITQNYDSTDSEVYVIIIKTLPTGTNEYANVWTSLQWKEIL
jgi:hypothetical protein